METYRHQEASKLESQRIGSSRRSNGRKVHQMLYERLHSEELKKRKKQSEERTPQRQGTPISTTRSQVDVVNHLYTDYFLRNEKLKSLQQFVKSQDQKVKKEAYDLKRSN